MLIEIPSSLYCLIARSFIEISDFDCCPDCKKSTCNMKFYIKSSKMNSLLNLVKNIIKIDYVNLDIETLGAYDIMITLCHIDLQSVY